MRNHKQRLPTQKSSQNIWNEYAFKLNSLKFETKSFHAYGISVITMVWSDL